MAVVVECADDQRRGEQIAFFEGFSTIFDLSPLSYVNIEFGDADTFAFLSQATTSEPPTTYPTRNAFIWFTIPPLPQPAMASITHNLPWFVKDPAVALIGEVYNACDVNCCTLTEVPTARNVIVH